MEKREGHGLLKEGHGATDSRVQKIGVQLVEEREKVEHDDKARIEYLKAALEENDPEFFVKAVGTVARAMGMTAVAQETHLGRPSLYKAPSGERAPRIGTVMKVLGALGIRLIVAPKAA